MMKRVVFASPEEMRQKKEAFRKKLLAADVHEVFEFFLLAAGLPLKYK